MCGCVGPIERNIMKSVRDDVTMFWVLRYFGFVIIYTFFYRQLDFSSEPGVANEILENS